MGGFSCRLSLSLFASHFGWRWSFRITAVLGVLTCGRGAVARLLEPEQHPHIMRKRNGKARGFSAVESHLKNRRLMATYLVWLCSFCIGLRTSRSGGASVPSGVTSVSVAHYLAVRRSIRWQGAGWIVSDHARCYDPRLHGVAGVALRWCSGRSRLRKHDPTAAASLRRKRQPAVSRGHAQA